MDYKSKYLKYKEKYVGLKYGTHPDLEGGMTLAYKYAEFDFNLVTYALRTKNNLSVYELKFDRSNGLKITLDFTNSNVTTIGAVPVQKVVSGFSAMFPEHIEIVSKHLNTYLARQKKTISLSGADSESLSTANKLIISLPSTGDFILSVNDKSLTIKHADQTCGNQILSGVIKAYFTNLVGNGQLMTKQLELGNKLKSDYYFTLDPSKAKFKLSSDGKIVSK
jgi:hypothetical protein